MLISTSSSKVYIKIYVLFARIKFQRLLGIFSKSKVDSQISNILGKIPRNGSTAKDDAVIG